MPCQAITTIVKLILIANAVLILPKSVQCNIIIKSGISHGEQQVQNGGVFGQDVKTGISSFEDAIGYDKNNEQKLVEAQDKGGYDEKIGEKKHHLDENAYDNKQFHQEGGGTIANVGSKTAHKKGHHKSGFHNTYRKDESGSNSSYFDDAADEGDQYLQHTKNGAYGNTGHQQNHGEHIDGNSYAKDQGKHGHYNNAGKYEHDLGNKKSYDQRRYYDDHNVHGNRNAGNQYGVVAHHDQHQLHSKPPYIPPKPYYYQRPEEAYYPLPPPPPPAQKRITIYEDPRVDYARYNRYEEPAYDGDYVRLDVKRSPIPPPSYRDYKNYDRQPYYDDYYY